MEHNFSSDIQEHLSERRIFSLQDYITLVWYLFLRSNLFEEKNTLERFFDDTCIYIIFRIDEYNAKEVKESIFLVDARENQKELIALAQSNQTTQATMSAPLNTEKVIYFTIDVMDIW